MFYTCSVTLFGILIKHHVRLQIVIVKSKLTTGGNSQTSLFLYKLALNKYKKADVKIVTTA